MKFLSIDIGTSAAKCQLFTESGEILEYLRDEYDLMKIDGESYVDTAEILSSVKRFISECAKKHTVDSVAFSSLGESFVLTDAEGNILFHPMLYTDTRGEKQAGEISSLIGDGQVFRITGTVPHPMYSVSKLLMIKEQYPEIYKKGAFVMLMVDYFGYLLTGERVIDYSLAARTGAFSVEELVFSREVLDPLGIDAEMFSRPARAGTVVGLLKEELCLELGLKNRPTLILGSHDQICTTLGAGALNAGEAVDGLGTVECITVLFDKKPSDFRMGIHGYPAVPFAKEGLYCTYILNYSCGSLVSWLRKQLMHGYKGDADSYFEYMEANMRSEPTKLLVLPYLGGAATPYNDVYASGAILNLTLDSTDKDIHRAILEGTAYEMRLNADFVSDFGIDLCSAVATGGGANSRAWLKIKSDIQGIPYTALDSSEGGLCGCAMLQAVAMGTAADLDEAKRTFVKYKYTVTPSDEHRDAYEANYRKYKKLYKTLKELNEQ